MKAKDTLEEIEDKRNNGPYCANLNYMNWGDQQWLIARVKKLTIALEKIMDSDPGPITMCETARKALDDE